ncbi:hypothetical protein SRABI26_04700 [Arthrobacter sp. Bi26]|nr:hypothetical protein SRABI26_04700 [Arthrobacter sp. Bi26]
MQTGHGGFDGASRVLHIALEAFEQDQAQGVDVTRWSEIGAAGLFRTEIGGRSHQGSRGRKPCPIDDPGNAEVCELGPKRLAWPDRHQEDVGGFDVPVDDAEPVDVSEGVGYPCADHGQLVQRQGTVADPGPQILAVYEFHGQEGPGFVGNPGVRPDVEQRHQAWMAQGCQQLDLCLLAAKLVRIS